MDRNTITGLLLIGLILVGTLFFLPKNKPEVKNKAVSTQTDTARTIKDTTTAALSDTLAQKDTTAAAVTANLPAGWASLAKGEEKEITIENDKMIVKVSTHGGRISYVQLKDYKTYGGKPLVLTKAESSSFGYQFFASGYDVNTSDLYFTPGGITDSSVTMNMSLPGGRSIQQSYSLPKEGYMMNYRLSMNGMNDVIPMKNQFLNMHWEDNILHQEKDSQIMYRNTTIFYRNTDEEPDDLSATSEAKEEVKREMQWVSFKQQFFCQTIISKTPFSYGDLSTQKPAEKSYIKNLKADLVMPYEHKPQEAYDMQFYFGPLKYKVLKSYNMYLERQIPLGWGIFGWVNRFLIIPVFNLLNDAIGNYGIIILILTVLIKLLVLPLTYRSYLTTAKMRVLKPELDELKAKYGDDMARQQSEQMKLYRSTGVSPFGGCLPLLLQFPFLIAMFRFFPSSIELRQQSFLWAKDLSTYDSIYTLPFHIPYYGDHVSLWTLLMTVSTLIYTKMNNSLSPQQNEFKWLSYIMPVVFLGFFNNYAAGLSMYYFFFNVLTFGQQYVFKLVIDDKKLKAQIEENKRKPKAQKKSGFQRRLEEMTKKQQELTRNQQQRKGGKR